jgi:uncharacterized membrane protein YbaN (DUF454 family)
MNKVKKILFITLGTLATVLGIVGIFIPILPTTPFLLLAAILFSNSSERFLNWLYNNRLCGEYIRNYREGRGMPIKQKIMTIFLLWLTIGISIIFLVEALWVKLILVAIALGVSIHLTSIKNDQPGARDCKDNHLRHEVKVELDASGSPD